MRLLGEPTAGGRADLLEHFIVSAGLTSLIGPAATESLGLLKELRDADAGTGFSLIDYQADLAGIEYAKAILANRQPLPFRAQDFSWIDVLPAPGDLAEGLTTKAIAERYGSLSDARFLEQRKEILSRVQAMPAYQAPPRSAGE